MDKEQRRKILQELADSLRSVPIGAQYFAYLEGDVCPFCKALDGLTISLKKKNGLKLFDKYSAAQHSGCQCTWSYIMGNEKFKDDNKDFEEKWVKIFYEQNPDLNDMSKEDILVKYAPSNLLTRKEYWIEEFGEEKFKELEERLYKISDKYRDFNTSLKSNYQINQREKNKVTGGTILFTCLVVLMIMFYISAGVGYFLFEIHKTLSCGVYVFLILVVSAIIIGVFLYIIKNQDKIVISK